MDHAYRPDPDAPKTLSPLLWRPWMTRLATVLIVAAAPASCLAGWLAMFNAWPPGQPSQPPTWLLFVLVCYSIHQLLAGVFALINIGFDDRPTAIRIAWAWLVYPILGAIKLVRWVAYGAQE